MAALARTHVKILFSEDQGNSAFYDAVEHVSSYAMHQFRNDISIIIETRLQTGTCRPYTSDERVCHRYGIEMDLTYVNETEY